LNCGNIVFALEDKKVIEEIKGLTGEHLGQMTFDIDSPEWWNVKSPSIFRQVNYNLVFRDIGR